MQVGSITSSGAKHQSALKLITDAVASAKVLASNASGSAKPWSTRSAAGSVSSRAASAIQDLAQDKTATTTFKRLGGSDQTLPTDEYEFFVKNTLTLKELEDDMKKTLVASYEVSITSSLSLGRNDEAAETARQLDGLKRSIAAGTFKVELLDDRVPCDHRWFGLRDSKGNVGGMQAETVTPFDWNAFSKVYGNGQGGYDKYYAAEAPTLSFADTWRAGTNKRSRLTDGETHKRPPA